ncbi:MAG TPA: dienelactone hydrolase family protein [Longimicrobiales bacterium]|nr:dienelactone hydrolase family protein [Longimicrobiales bacterium]
MKLEARTLAALALALPLAFSACGSGDDTEADPPAEAETVASPAQNTLPAGEDDATARLDTSPRHGEWVMIRSGQDSIRSWVVYPERADNAPVVVVIHEIFGLSNWIRAVADQLAADGFIAIAPDLLTMKGVPYGADGESDATAARTEIRTLDNADVHRWLGAVAQYGMDLPAARDTYGVVGFCWGGAASFAHAIAAPDLGAAVVYYGTSPATESLSSIRAPVLGLYGSDDQRVNATIPDAEAAMRSMNKTFETHIFDGAGHGFLRAQSGQEGANMAATREAWPLTVGWFRRTLGG